MATRSVVVWVTHDGKEATLPRAFHDVLLVHKGATVVCRYARGLWLLGSRGRRKAVGDTWAYLPEPPEINSQPAGDAAAVEAE